LNTRDILFKTEYLGYSAKEIQKLKKNDSPKDQIFRYHTDRGGKKWDGIQGFDAVPFLPTLEIFQQDMDRIVTLLLSRN